MVILGGRNDAFWNENNIRPALLFAIVSMRNVLNVGKKENAFILCVYRKEEHE